VVIWGISAPHARHIWGVLTGSAGKKIREKNISETLWKSTGNEDWNYVSSLLHTPTSLQVHTPQRSIILYFYTSSDKFRKSFYCKRGAEIAVVGPAHISYDAVPSNRVFFKYNFMNAKISSPQEVLCQCTVQA
jgi:hypothetical protein